MTLLMPLSVVPMPCMVELRMSGQESVAIEIVCATPAKQILVRSNVRHGTTARQAVDAATAQ